MVLIKNYLDENNYKIIYFLIKIISKFWIEYSSDSEYDEYESESEFIEKVVKCVRTVKRHSRVFG